MLFLPSRKLVHILDSGWRFGNLDIGKGRSIPLDFPCSFHRFSFQIFKGANPSWQSSIDRMRASGSIVATHATPRRIRDKRSLHTRKWSSTPNPRCHDQQDHCQRLIKRGYTMLLPKYTTVHATTLRKGLNPVAVQAGQHDLLVWFILR